MKGVRAAGENFAAFLLQSSRYFFTIIVGCELIREKYVFFPLLNIFPPKFILAVFSNKKIYTTVIKLGGVEQHKRDQKPFKCWFSYNRIILKSHKILNLHYV